MLTLLELTDVSDKPKVKLDLPSPLRIGDRIRLAFCLRRLHAGRAEVLEVFGEYRVKAVGFDFTQKAGRQVLAVESSTAPPHWRAVKKQTPWKRVVPPAVAPKKTIE